MTRGVQLVICGLGGQGILFLTRLLAEAACGEGRDVITAESHGMAQRGGAVDSHVKIGPFAGPLVRRGRADAVIALDASRVGDARAFGRAEAPCFVNSTLPVDGARAIDAGSDRTANLALLGLAVASAPALFPSADAIDGALARLSPPAALEANRAALRRGRGAA